MSTWDDAHAGAVVLGHDGRVYGVAAYAPHPAGPVITLVHDGVELPPAQPPPGTPIEILKPADVAAEAAVFGMFADAGLGPELLYERYEP